MSSPSITTSSNMESQPVVEPTQALGSENQVEKKDKPVKKEEKLEIACVYCRRSHMICDESRPCQRCIKRGIGHLCYDEPSNPRQRKKLLLYERLKVRVVHQLQLQHLIQFLIKYLYQFLCQLFQFLKLRVLQQQVICNYRYHLYKLVLKCLLPHNSCSNSHNNNYIHKYHQIIINVIQRY